MKRSRHTQVMTPLMKGWGGGGPSILLERNRSVNRVNTLPKTCKDNHNITPVIPSIALVL